MSFIQDVLDYCLLPDPIEFHDDYISESNKQDILRLISKKKPKRVKLRTHKNKVRHDKHLKEI